MPQQSPSQTVGPFFYNSLIRGGENILVNDQTRGQHILIQGTVYDGDGRPIPDAMVEIWQADAQGTFNHPHDPNQDQADPHFTGFGRHETSDNGRYWFKTVKPGLIPGQEASIVNMRVFARGMLIHAVTRVYFSDDPGRANDPVLNSVEASRRRTLVATLSQGTDLPTYHFDIHMQGEAETVFFDP